MREQFEPDQSESQVTEHVAELLDRYLVAKRPQDDTEGVLRALQRAGADPVKLEHLRELWDTHRRVQISADDRIVGLRRHLNLPSVTTANSSAIPVTPGFAVKQAVPLASQTLHPFRPARRLLTAIGGVAIAASLLVVGWLGRGEYTEHRIAEESSVYSTAYGQRATVVLPDGTIAILNVGSRLEVPANYASGNRNVRLHGEAFFTVTHHTSTPFTVTAGNSITRVLGTSFLVRHYSTDTAALVAVKDGKVTVGSMILSANEQATVGSNLLPVQGVATLEQLTFANGVLTLDGLPLRDALVELNRWYNADIRIGDAAITERRIKGGFPAGSLSDLTERLEWTFNMRVVRSGRILTLYSN